MLEEGQTAGERVRAAELIAALSLATDMAMGVSLEYGLQSTLIAMRLADRMGVKGREATQTYYACLLFYVGCTTNADLAADIFADDYGLTTYGVPVRFGSRPEMMAGLLRAVAPPGGGLLARGQQLTHGLPKLARLFKDQIAALCEVAQILTARLGLSSDVGDLFFHLAERWDGKGDPGNAKREEIPLPVRIVHVARDAAFQRTLGGTELAASVVRERAGGAFDPDIAHHLADDAEEILSFDDDSSVWDETLACEPLPQLDLEEDTIDRAVTAMGDFADISSPYLVGHSRGVAEVAAAAANLWGLKTDELAMIHRAAAVHDLGRVAVPVRIWQKPGRLTPDEWERVRLHPYYSERILSHSPFLAALAPVATNHHERSDGSGYHRGLTSPNLLPAARLLAAADAYHAMTEPRPHRPPVSTAEAARTLTEEAQAGRLDREAVASVIEASGQRAERIRGPLGLTEREMEVVGFLARGFQTKQIARALGISAKTADRHIQNAYGKMGISTRAGAALFAVEHGLIAWGELPISSQAHRI